MSTIPNRVHRGVPTGGQYAEKKTPEADIHLSGIRPATATVDERVEDLNDRFDQGIQTVTKLAAHADDAERLRLHEKELGLRAGRTMTAGLRDAETSDELRSKTLEATTALFEEHHLADPHGGYRQGIGVSIEYVRHFTDQLD